MTVVQFLEDTPDVACLPTRLALCETQIPCERDIFIGLLKTMCCQHFAYHGNDARSFEPADGPCKHY